VAEVDVVTERDAVRMLARYADALHEWRLEDWADFFTEEARYEIVPRENLERLGEGVTPLGIISCPDRRFIDDRVKAIRKATVYGPQVYRHLFGNVVVDELGAGRTAVRANYAVYRTTPPGEAELFSVGGLEATVVDGDPARFASLRFICDGLVPGYLVLPL